MFLLFDIGGSNMRFAVSRDGEKFDPPKIVPTPKDFSVAMEAIGKIAEELAGSEHFTGAAGGIAGTLSRDRRTFVNGPHLVGWNGKPVAQALEDVLGCPVFLENDTAIVGLGEAVAGAGKDFAIVAYMTVSTGVGGVRIVNKTIDVSALGFEPGHQIIDADGTVWQHAVCGKGLDLEGQLSGTAISERYNKKPYEINDPIFWDDMARILAYGLNNTIVHWSPDVVVIGGSMMKQIGIPIDRVRAHLEGILHIYPELPQILHSDLGDIGGIHGALHFLKSKLAR